MASTDSTIDAEALTATQSLIKRLSNQLDELTSRQKEINEMIKGVLENDEELQKAEDIAKEASKAAKSRKRDLNDLQETKDLKLKAIDVKEDIKMVKESLNTHLLNYFQMTSSTVIDFPDGQERQIIFQAKLKPVRK